ncbi:MAG TPA: RHS repeat-associated core domain-containing protein [Bacillota bacterium]|nr:RHS repeat-associated core domain-containing protein [Bacillota bacterium]
MKLKNGRFLIIIFLLLVFTFQLSDTPIHAYDQVWDQGHQTSNPNGDDPTDPRRRRNQGDGGDPVNLYTGNYGYQHIDFTVHGRGMDVIFQRVYNTQDLYNGPFGSGWNFLYNQKSIVTMDNPQNTTDSCIVLRKWDGTRYQIGEKKVGETYQYTYPAEFKGTVARKIETNTIQVFDEDGRKFYEYDMDGKLLKISDRNGNRISFSYSANGRLEYFKDTVDRLYNITYNSSGKIASITDPANQIYQYRYDSLGRLTDYIEPGGGVEKYGYQGNTNLLTDITNSLGVTWLRNTYDSKQKVTSQFYNGASYLYTIPDGTGNKTVTLTNRRGKKTTYTLNDTSKPLNATDSLGNSTAYTYNTAGSVLTFKNTNGDNFSFTYDANQNCTKLTDPLGQTEIMTYNSLNQITSFTDRASHKTEFFYDERGNQIEIKNALATSKHYSYDEHGAAIEAQDYNGQVTRFEYDDYGNITGIINPLNQRTAKKYDILGRLLEITDPKGNKTTYTYEYNRLKTITDAKGNVITFSYDSEGKPTEIRDALNRVIKYEYDNWGKPTALIDPLGNRTSYFYDEEENLTKVVDANGNATNYQYDALNRLEKVIDAKGNATQYFYNKNSKIIKIQDAKGNTNLYEYDKLSRLTKETDPLNQIKNYTYTPTDQIKTITKPDGAFVEYQYDNINRILEAAFYTDNIKSTIQRKKIYAYDNMGNILSESEGQNTLAFEYNPLGYLTKATDIFGRSIDYSYDQAGNCASLTLPGQKAFTYTYDELNRLLTVTAPNQDVFRYEYDAAGRRTKLSYPNGKEAFYSYDALNRLLSFNNGVNGYNYSYDNTVNIKSMTTENGITTYNYDAVYQLTGATYEDGTTESYTYDELGNRLTKTTPDGTVNYTYNAANQLTFDGSFQYRYDPNGNLVEKTDGASSIQYKYSPQGNLISVLKNSEELASFLYDPQGRRAQSQKGSGIIQYLWDGNSLAGEYSPDSSLQSIFARGSGVDEVLGIYRDAAAYVHTDHLGSLVAVTDAGGSTLLQQKYNPFGGITSSTGSYAANFGFIGREYDTDTGLLYLRARYFDPSTGRFISPDPAKDGANWYVYCNANPVNYVDRNGLFLDTLLDIGFTIYDIYQLIKNPSDPMNWISLGADVACIVVPGLTGGGAAVRAAGRADDLYDVARAADRADDLYDAERAVKEADDAFDASRLHGNDLRTSKPAEGYSLRDRDTGEVLKYGETTQGTKRYSQKYLDENNADMVFEASGSKKEMHDWQHDKILDYKGNNGGNRPPMNKSDW